MQKARRLPGAREDTGGHIGLGQQPVQILRAIDGVKALDGPGTAAYAENPAVKAPEPPGQGAADVPGAENQHGLPLQGGLLPAGVPEALPLEGGVVGQLAAEGEDTGQHMLGNHGPVDAGAVGHHGPRRDIGGSEFVDARPDQVKPPESFVVRQLPGLQVADDGLRAGVPAVDQRAAAGGGCLQPGPVPVLYRRGNGDGPHGSASGSGRSTTMGAWWMAGSSFSSISSRVMVSVEVEMHGWQDTSRPS